MNTLFYVCIVEESEKPIRKVHDVTVDEFLHINSVRKEKGDLQVRYEGLILCKGRNGNGTGTKG